MFGKMPRKEVINRWFFPSVVRKGGLVFPAPEEAVEKYEDLRDNWLKKQTRLPHEVPAVVIGPGEEEGREGYFVTTEIEYKDQVYETQS